MKVIQACLFVVLSVLSVNLYAACPDVGGAKTLYLRATKGEATDDTVDLLKQSAQLCENYAVYYKLGINQLKRKQYQQSLESFKNAQRFVEFGSTQEAVLLGRMAIAYFQLNDLANALAVIEAAHEVYVKQKEAAPNWLVAVRQDIDIALAQTLYTADKINETLLSMKSFGVKPKINIKILFATRSVLIDEQGIAQIKELGKSLLPYVQAGQRVLIIGHTDTIGGEQYNQQLSENRAISVVKALVAIYPELEGHLEYKGKGFSQLRYKGDQEKIHRLNRRVEVQFL